MKKVIKASKKTPISKPKKVVLIIVVIICAGMLTYNAVTLIRWYIDGQNIAEEASEAEEVADTTEIDDEGEPFNAPDDKNSDYWYYIRLPFTNVDLSELKKINSDTVGFLNVAGTNINYPVVQAKDNKYYLTNSFQKKYNEAGWIFMDYRNNPSFSDQNTVIYGHGRLDTTMFGTLKNILSTGWVNNKDNYVIRYSSESENMLFQVFSVYTVPVESYYIRTSFGDSASYTKWLNTMIGRSQYNFGTTVNGGDKVLTLSTCNDTEDKRIVMHAKLIKKMSKT